MTTIRSIFPLPTLHPRLPATRLSARTALLALGSAGLLNACGGGGGGGGGGGASAPAASGSPAPVAPRAPVAPVAPAAPSPGPIPGPPGGPASVAPATMPPAPASQASPAAVQPAAVSPEAPPAPPQGPPHQGHDIHIRVAGLPRLRSLSVEAGGQSAVLRGSKDFDLRHPFPGGSVQRLGIERQPRGYACRFDQAQVRLARTPGAPGSAAIRCTALRRAFVLLSGGFLQAFAIGPRGRLSALQSSALAVGAHARALAVAPGGAWVYVAGGARPDSLGIVAVGRDGTLLLQGSLELPAHAHAAALALSPDGTTLFVACERGQQVLAFGVNASTGALIALGGVSTITADGMPPAGSRAGADTAPDARRTPPPQVVDPAMEPSALAVDPRGRYLYVGGRDGSVEAFRIVPTTARPPAPPPDGHPWALRWAARGRPFGARGRIALACDARGDLLAADSADPALKMLAAPAAPARARGAGARGRGAQPWRATRVGTVLRGAAQDLAFNPRTHSLYVSVVQGGGGFTSAIQAFRVQAADGGSLRALSPPTTPWIAGSALGALAVAPGGRSVYALDAAGMDVAQYTVEAAGGPLALPGGAARLARGLPLAMSPASVLAFATPVAIALQP